VLVFAGSDPRVSAFTQVSTFSGRETKSGHYARSTAKQQVSDSIAVGVLGEPYFVDEDTSIKNVTAQLGVTTYLHCRVNSLGGKTVILFKNELFIKNFNFTMANMKLSLGLCTKFQT